MTSRCTLQQSDAGTDMKADAHTPSLSHTALCWDLAIHNMLVIRRIGILLLGFLPEPCRTKARAKPAEHLWKLHIIITDQSSDPTFFTGVICVQMASYIREMPGKNFIA